MWSLARLFGPILYFFLVLAAVYRGRYHVSMVVAKASRSDLSKVQIRKSNTKIIDSKSYV
ncbi:hypothetical protein BuS5_00773 [Desulfosarcina sp. BuS5]|nr:hypothetical protein BuS5_00773 [Desulfosarcina sp. BuS5]